MSIKRPNSGWKTERVTVHPGEILREEFMQPLGLSANKLALELRVPATRVHEIANQRRAISVDTALRLARHFGTTAEFWLNLQKNYELSVAKLQTKEQIEKEVRPRTGAA
jgi:addiction module HigA family antidote